MITTDEMRILLSINGAASYTTTINEITNVTKNYDKSVGNLISTLAKLVTTGYIVKFGKQCIEAASNLQEVANVVNVTFGPSADKINNWAKSNAASFGLSETAAKRYAGTFGTMAKQFNFTTDQAAKMSIELTKLSGDVASFYNISDSSAATKLKAVFTGETESLKELGVVMTQTQLDSYAMANGWNKTTKEMSEQEKVALRYSYTMEKLAHAQGDFSRTSDGYANSLRTMKLEFENMKIQVGKELLPVAAMGIQYVIKGIQTISPIIKGIAQTVRLYTEAWKNASERTRSFAKAALACFAVMAVAPVVINVVSKAVKLLTIDVLTLKGALGLLGMVFTVLALKGLSDSVKEMKASNKQLGDLTNSANQSAEAMDALSDSVDGLSDSTKGLNTFLASFDEVNKVGGGGSLMSSLVTSQDLSNIIGAASGVEDLQNELNSLKVPDMNKGFFLAEWWEEKKNFVKGFLDTFGTSEFIENWLIGADQLFGDLLRKFDSFMQTVFSKSYQMGAHIYDMLFPNADTDNSEWLGGNGETFTFTSSVTGKQREALKYNSDGTATDLYLKYGMGSQSASQTAATTATAFIGPQQQPVINFNPTITMDGEKVSRMVANNLNNMTRSGGDGPLMAFE